jgi:hypothetical protein
MQWFDQTPEHSFKNTLSHSIVLVVFVFDLAALSIPLFMRSGAPPAHGVSKGAPPLSRTSWEAVSPA